METPIKFPTAGRAALAELVHERGAQARLAKQLRVAEPLVSKWVRGDNRPDPHLRVVIELALGISRDAWFTPAELAAIDRARVAASVGHGEAA